MNLVAQKILRCNQKLKDMNITQEVNAPAPIEGKILIKRQRNNLYLPFDFLKHSGNVT